MIEIRSQQTEQLTIDFKTRFHDQIYSYLCLHLPDLIEPQPKRQVMEQIAASHVRSEEREITRKPDIVRFAALWIVMGPDFDQKPEVDLYLKAPGWSMTTKLDQLMQGIADHLRIQSNSAS